MMQCLNLLWFGGQPFLLETSSKESVLRAIISDIHANLEALEAVLADIRGQNISEIYCLGSGDGGVWPLPVGESRSSGFV